MKRPRPGIVTELFPVFLILGSVGGTLGLVLAMQRSAGKARVEKEPVAAVAPATVPQATPLPLPPAPKPAPPPPVVVIPPPPPEDPTKKLIAGIASQEAEQRRAATEADRRAEALGKAIRAASAASSRWKRREAIVRAQVDGLSEKAQQLELEAEALAIERDALARERDASKAALEKARAEGGGYAVMPNRGPNGTWQRPVVIECRNGQAILQPRGLAFTMLDMSPLMGFRSSPLIGAVAREMLRIQEVASPDGAPVIPYIYFIVRPDGIRPFYEARARLEPLGIAFGYELVDQDWNITFPDVETWDVGGPTRPKNPGQGAGTGPGDFAWPADRPGTPSGDDKNPFLWPRTQPGSGSGSGSDSSEGVGLDDLDGRRPTGRPGRPGSSNLTDNGQPGLGGRTIPGRSVGSEGVGAGVPGAGATGSGRPGQVGGVGGSPGRFATQSEGVDVAPLFNRLGGRGPSFGSSPDRVPGGGGTRSGTGGSTLSPISPEGLPGFDPAGSPSTVAGGLAGMSPSGSGRGGQGPAGSVGPPRLGSAPSGRSGAPGAGWTVSPSAPNGNGNGGGSGDQPASTGVSPGQVPGGGSGLLGDPARLSGLPPGLIGGLAASGPARGPSNKTGAAGVDTLANGKDASTAGADGQQGDPTASPKAGSGRVRIDPSTLALAQEEDEDRPPTPPLALRPGNSTSAGSGTSATGGLEGTTGPGGNSQGTQDRAGSGGSSTSPNGTASNGGSASSSSSPNGLPSPFGALGSGTEGAPAGKGAAHSRKDSKIIQPLTVEVPLDLVVACGSDGLILHPGGYRLSMASLKKERKLKSDLVTIVRNHELIDPSIRPKPRLQFLVEPGGDEAYLEARKQTVLSGLNWPVTIHPAASQAPRVFPKERF